MQDFVAFGSKKRAADLITKADSERDAENTLKELSPVEHVHNYFKKLKKAREDDSEEEDGNNFQGV